MTTELEGQQKSIRRVLETIVFSLVDYPNEVTIAQENAEGLTTFHILVGHEGDAGKLIGKQGRTAQSIRTIILACSMKHHLRFAVDIEKPTSTRRDE